MSRRGECHDNAAAESFFGHLKEELVYRSVFHTRPEAIEAVLEYIKYYNVKRLPPAFDYLSPIEDELNYYCRAAAV